MKTNFQQFTDKILQQIDLNKKPSLLLHACCGPCSSYVLEYLYKFFNITVYYYNPNIYPQTEYVRRLTELKDLYKNFPPAIEGNIILIEETYNPDDFYSALDINAKPELAKEPEKGERCRRCYKFRLKKAYEYACSHNFDYYCTTLSISPFKDAEKINQLGIEIVSQKHSENPSAFQTKWLPSDFKKKGGFKRSLELSDEYNLYRQDYCGCIYSKKSREDYEKSKSLQNSV